MKTSASRLLTIAICIAASNAAPLPAQVAQERVDLTTFARIREEGLQRSQIEPLARHLVEGIGPRLTGSTGMQRANAWTADKFREWGLRNVAVEPWGRFGRGWEQISFFGRVTSPFVLPLNGIAVAWTGSTPGRVTGRVVVVKGGREELLRRGNTLRGSFVMLGEPITEAPPSAHADPRRSLEEMIGAPPGAPSSRIHWDSLLKQLHIGQGQLDSALRNAGVAGVLSGSRLYGLLISNGNWWSATTPGAPEAIPEVRLQQEQYNRLYRLAEQGTAITVEIDVQNRFLTNDLQQYNTLADLPGSDKADEYVMIGAHLDSWHAGTGATDNAAGTVVMMEAMRILKTLGVTPRRTIRVALWSGEEQGLYGSRRYLAKHPELHSKISAYLNLDNGTGKIRGLWSQQNERAISTFEQIFWPFRDLGVIGVRRADTGGSDHLAFDDLGIPGFGFVQDPMEYSFWTHHTDIDTYDHLSFDDLRQAAVIVAATAYHLAMRDEMLPRKTAPVKQ